ncbi:MAG: hypothetical protein FWG16_05715, partial [Micrococcales bacterium]|nr:hypothetical protein [Micrococcales bacterium]
MATEPKQDSGAATAPKRPRRATAVQAAPNPEPTVDPPAAKSSTRTRTRAKAMAGAPDPVLFDAAGQGGGSAVVAAVAPVEEATVGPVKSRSRAAKAKAGTP